MKSRHVRAVAVFGIAVFALTGARGSSGGGCSGGSSSSSSSSGSSGGSDSGSSTTTGGSTTSGTGGLSNSKGAARDLKIESCAYDNGLVARVRATNSSSATAYSYKFDVEFTDSNGKVVHTADDEGILAVPADSSDTLDVTVPQSAVDAGDFSTSGGSCKLTDLARFAG